MPEQSLTWGVKCQWGVHVKWVPWFNKANEHWGDEEDFVLSIYWETLICVSKSDEVKVTTYPNPHKCNDIRTFIQHTGKCDTFFYSQCVCFMLEPLPFPKEILSIGFMTHFIAHHLTVSSYHYSDRCQTTLKSISTTSLVSSFVLFCYTLLWFCHNHQHIYLYYI